MTPFSGKQTTRGWLFVAGGMKEKPNESPRLAAMQRMRAKRAAAKARAAGAAGQEEEKSQEDEIKPNKLMRTVVEVHQNHAPSLQAHPQPPRSSVRENRSFVLASQPPPTNQVFVLATPPPPTNQVYVLAPPPQPWPTLTRVTMIRRPTHTLQLLPLDNPHYRSTVIGRRRAWVARAAGGRMSGWISWSTSLDDVVINCECHNLMFNAVGFLNHAGWNGMSIDRPSQHIMVENPRSL